MLLLGLNKGFFTRPSFFPEILLFLVFTTLVIYIYLSKAGSPAIFVRLYLLLLMLKLVAYGVFLFIIILKDRAAIRANVTFFLVTYFVFTVLEIGFLYHKINHRTRP
jgi:hypothetical protein